MIDIVTAFKSTRLDIPPVPYVQYVYRLTVSIAKASENIAAWWQTTFSGGNDFNEVRTLVGSFWDGQVQYNEKNSLDDCIDEEKSFYYDAANDPQFLYIHVDHNLRPITTEQVLFAGYGQGYSSSVGCYIDDVYYEPRITNIFPYNVEVDPLEIGKPKKISGKISFKNQDGHFDDNDSLRGAKIKGYKYDLENDPIRVFSCNVENESHSGTEYGVTVKDPREFDNVKIILERWTTAELDAGHKKLGKEITLCFGEVNGLECVDMILPTAGYKKFKGCQECLTVDAAYVQDDNVWTSVTVYNSSTDGSFELANADCLDADGKLLPVKADYTCAYSNTADRIVYYNSEFVGISYDDTNYNTALWETERFAFDDCGVIIDKDVDLLNQIAKEQAGQRWPFYYWINKNDQRSIKISNPNRTPRYSIDNIDIMNFDRPAEQDNTTYATSLEIQYSYDQADKTYQSYINTDYREDVFREFRQYKDKQGDEAKKTYITTSAEAQTASIIRMEDWSAVHRVFTIDIPRWIYPDLEILDMVNIDLSFPEDSKFSYIARPYFGDKLCKVIGMSYIENDLIRASLRVETYSTIIEGIGGYMAEGTVQILRITADDSITMTANTLYYIINYDTSSHTITHDEGSIVLPSEGWGFVYYTGSEAKQETFNSSGISVEVQSWVQSQGYLTSGVPVTGTIVQYAGATAPTDWLLCEGETIGDASSGADYAGADYEDLFDLLNAARWGNPGGAVWGDHDTVKLPDFRNVTVYGANSSTRSVGGRTQDAMALGATHTDQFQGWQLGCEEDGTGARDYWSRSATRDVLHQTGASAGYTNTANVTSAQGDSRMFKAMNDGTNGDPSTGTTTKAAGLAATFIIKI